MSKQAASAPSSLARHTPGPWRVGDAGHTIFGPKSDQPAPVTVANLPAVSPRVNAEQRAANAVLIAAAPDLLAACRYALDCATNKRDGRTLEEMAAKVREMLSEAIAKAEGRSQASGGEG